MGIKNQIHKLESKNPRGGYERGVDDGLNDAANLVAKEADELMQEMVEVVKMASQGIVDEDTVGAAKHVLQKYVDWEDG